MEKIKLELAKIVGTPSEHSWSQVHTFTPDDSSKLSKRGKLLAVVCLNSVEAGVEAVALGREILARLHEEYYGNLEGGILARLKTALEKIKTEWPETEITAGAVLSQGNLQVLYLAILGKGRVLIKREGLLTELLAGSGQEKIENGSGFIKAGDILLFGNGSFFEIVSAGVIKASLGLGNPQEMIESLAPIVLSRPELGQTAALVCLLVEEKTEEIEVTSFEQEEAREEVISQPSAPANFGKRLASALLKLKNKLPKIKPGSFYIRREARTEKKNKLAISVAIILVFLLLGSLLLGAFKRNQAEKENRVKNLFSQAEGKYNEAKGLAGQDPDGTVVLLEEAVKFLDEAKKIIPPDGSQEIVFLQSEIEKLLSKNKKSFELGELSVFFDLGLFKEGSKATAGYRYQDQLVILDQAKTSLYLLDLKNKSSTVFSSEKLTRAEKVVYDGQQVFVLTSEGILAVDMAGKKVATIIGKDENWGKISDLGIFNGNLYLLDAEKRTIWQYLKTETGFSQIKNWLSSGSSFEGEIPNSLAIDGSIWVLTKEGKIHKFIRGSEEVFTLSGFSGDLGQIDGLHTGFESSFLYLLNAAEKKVYLISKEGKFQSRYYWKSSEKPELMISWESEKKVLIFAGNFLFSFNFDLIPQ